MSTPTRSPYAFYLWQFTSKCDFKLGIYSIRNAREVNYEMRGSGLMSTPDSKSTVDLDKLRQKLKSGNAIPVERVSLLAWELEWILDRLMSTQKSKARYAVIQLDESLLLDNVVDALQQAEAFVNKRIAERWWVLKVVAKVTPEVHPRIEMEQE